jgi:hypothetical protein
VALAAARAVERARARVSLLTGWLQVASWWNPRSEASVA